LQQKYSAVRPKKPIEVGGHFAPYYEDQ